MKFQQWSPNLIICKWHLLTTNAQSSSFLGEINKYIEHKNGNTTNLSETALSNSRIQLNINSSHFFIWVHRSQEKLWKLSIRFINLPVTAHENKKKNFKNALFANTEKKVFPDKPSTLHGKEMHKENIFLWMSLQIYVYKGIILPPVFVIF